MKNKKKWSGILAVSLLVLASSCGTKAVINPKQVGGNNTGLAGTMGNKMTLSETGEYGGYLGYGYDIAYDGYFNSSDISAGALVLDMDALVKDGLVYSVANPTPTSSLYMGETLKAYQQDVSTQIGTTFSYGLFFSSVKGSFSLSEDTSTSVSSKNVYIKNQVKIGKERQYINTSAISFEDLKKYANKKVLEALNSDTSKLSQEKKQQYYDKLFSTYGTHILADVVVGGRMDLNYVYNNTESKSRQTIKTEVNAAYSSLKAKVSGSVDKEIDTKATSFVSKTSFQCTRRGGTVEGDITTFEEAKGAYKAWAESIQNNVGLELVDVGDSCESSLIGLWKLADANKHDEIYLAYLNYMNTAGKLFADIDEKAAVKEVPLYVKNIYIGSASSGALASSDIESQISQNEPNALYTIVPKDLNKGVKGDYIYVGYTLTTNKSEAVTDIKVEWWSKASNASATYNYKGITYNCIKKDLNKGAGGKYIYLYYTKNTSAGSPLTDIGVETDGSYSFGSTAKGWVSAIGLTSSSKTDCNKGSGGPYIYLWYKR